MFRALLTTLAVALTLLVTGTARAQSNTFYLDRLQVSGAPDDGFTVWRPYMHPRTRFYGSAALAYSHNPLRIDTVTDDPVAANEAEDIMDGQLITHLTVGTQIAKRLGINVALPIALWNNSFDQDPTVYDVGTGLDVQSPALHDVRIDLRAAIFETDDRFLRVGGGLAIWAPTGNEDSFASDGGSSWMPFANAEFDFDAFFISGMAGWHFKPSGSIGGANGTLYVEDELRWAAGAYIPLRDGKIRLGGEIWGTAGFGDADGFDDQPVSTQTTENTHLEWLGQIRFALDEKNRTYAQAGGGTRLADGYGSADFRIIAQIGSYFELEDFEPESPPRRYSNIDVSDQAKDTDGDGYPDDVDLCPTVKEDKKEPNPTDGCPAPKDSDGDGILDDVDKCPDVPEDKDGIADQDGCPEDDADEDGIPDVEDKCPLQKGLKRKNDPEKHGCPSDLISEEGDEIKLLKPIQFETARATIKRVSYPILDDVVALMEQRPELRIGVYGHTDSRGSRALNMRLSKARAKSVMDYLVSKGIARNRLESEGFGPDKPVDTNDTAEGRARNRRVEFIILGDDDDDDE